MSDGPPLPVAGSTVRPHRPWRAPMPGTTGMTSVDGGSKPARRVGGSFIVLYAQALLSTSLLFLAPLLVTLALKVNSLVGTERAPNSLSLVAGRRRGRAAVEPGVDRVPGPQALVPVLR